MSPVVRRLFIAFDEWAGILVIIYLRNDPWLFYFLVPWIVAIYFISYPWHWYLQAKAVCRCGEEGNERT